MDPKWRRMFQWFCVLGPAGLAFDVAITIAHYFFGLPMLVGDRPATGVETAEIFALMAAICGAVAVVGFRGMRRARELDGF